MVIIASLPTTLSGTLALGNHRYQAFRIQEPNHLSQLAGQIVQLEFLISINSLKSQALKVVCLVCAILKSLKLVPSHCNRHFCDSELVSVKEQVMGDITVILER